MHCLETLRMLNDRAANRQTAETETTRHCSYSGDAISGVVLHSSKQRSTAFLEGRAAVKFLADWLGTNSTTIRDSLVESYF